MVRLTILATLLLPSTLAWAQQAATELKVPQGEPGEVRSIYLAADLARHSRTLKDPLGLVTAARIAKASGLAAKEYDPWLKEAVDLAKGDKTITALADDVRASATKGRTVSAPPPDDLVVQASATNMHSSKLDPGERVELALMAAEGLTMIVRDPAGDVLCRTTAPGYCAFWANSPEVHTVEVRNSLGQPSPYRLVVRRTPPMKAEVKQ